MPMDYEICGRLANAARTPYLRDVHPGGACTPMDYESVSPARRARHTLGACTLVEHACPWFMIASHHSGVHAIPYASHQRGVHAIP